VGWNNQFRDVNLICCPVAELAVVISAGRPDTTVRLKEGCVEPTGCHCNNAARYNLLGLQCVVRGAVSELAILVVPYSPQAAVRFQNKLTPPSSSDRRRAS